MLIEEKATLIRLVLFGAGLIFFLAMELIRPYRPATVGKSGRWFINLGLTGFNSLVLAFVVAQGVLAMAVYVSQNQLGFLNNVGGPYWLKVVVGVAAMDLVIYVWHLLNHVVPVFWRFHRVHHTDLNMDVSTATRFHIGELGLSIVLKLAVIYAVGLDVLMVLLFETLVILAAQFHHSMIRISPRFEAVWWMLFVPPSMHRIHHSVKINERNSNYGGILSIWDRIMGTMVTDVDQDRIRIGVGGHFDKSELGLHKLLIMPFMRYVR